jgi:integrase
MRGPTTRLHTAVFSTGERFPILLNCDGIPISLPTRYVIDRRRDRRQLATIRSIVRAISFFYEWSATIAEPFDPEVRLRAGPMLEVTEIMGLQRYLRAGRRHNVIAFPRVAVARSRNGTVIANTNLNNQLDRIRDFLLWAAECVRVPRATHRELKLLKGRIDGLHLTRTRSADKYGLTAEQQAELLRVVAVAAGNSDNPFNCTVRARNHAIVRLLLETGIRRGELCKLRVEDIDLRASGSGSISIVRNPDDPWDSRREEPEVKQLPDTLSQPHEPPL